MKILDSKTNTQDFKNNSKIKNRRKRRRENRRSKRL